MIKAYGIALYKYEQNSIKLLLCKSVKSKDKYGFLKGVQLKNETNEQTAIREFYEESGIKVANYNLEEFFIQKNEDKDIGIYMVDYHKIDKIDGYFKNDYLKNEYLCKENSEVKFFDIKNLHYIKKKQIEIVQDIINYVNKKT